MTLVIQGSLMLENVLDGHPQDYQVRGVQEECDALYGHIIIAQPHMTILSSHDLKPLQMRSDKSNREFREWMEEMIPTLPPAPDVLINTTTIRKSFRKLDDGSVKESCCLFLSDNLSFLDWRDEIMDALGVLVEDIDTSRPFHISIANLTGNPHDSVANPRRGEEE